MYATDIRGRTIKLYDGFWVRDETDHLEIEVSPLEGLLPDSTTNDYQRLHLTPLTSNCTPLVFRPSKHTAYSSKLPRSIIA